MAPNCNSRRSPRPNRRLYRWAMKPLTNNVKNVIKKVKTVEAVLCRNPPGQVAIKYRREERECEILASSHARTTRGKFESAGPGRGEERGLFPAKEDTKRSGRARQRGDIIKLKGAEDTERVWRALEGLAASESGGEGQGHGRSHSMH